MKKYFIPIIVIAILSLALVGMASAQAPDPPQPESPEGYFGRGRMGSWSGRGAGMWGRGWSAGGPFSSEEYGPMHDQMVSALSEAFDISVENLEARHDAGETMWSIAEDLGLSFEQFRDLMSQAREKALSQAVAEGVISQEQYDWMLSRMNQMWSGDNQAGIGRCGGVQRGFGMYGGWMYR